MTSAEEPLSTPQASPIAEPSVLESPVKVVNIILSARDLSRASRSVGLFITSLATSNPIPPTVPAIPNPLPTAGFLDMPPIPVAMLSAP